MSVRSRLRIRSAEDFQAASPFTEAQMVSVNLDEEVKLFLEPGDQLHLDADLLDLPQSLHFSGQGAANNQFLAALRSRFPDYLRINYEGLKVDAQG